MFGKVRLNTRAVTLVYITLLYKALYLLTDRMLDVYLCLWKTNINYQTITLLVSSAGSSLKSVPEGHTFGYCRLLQKAEASRKRLDEEAPFTWEVPTQCREA